MLRFDLAFVSTSRDSSEEYLPDIQTDIVSEAINIAGVEAEMKLTMISRQTK